MYAFSRARFLSFTSLGVATALNVTLVSCNNDRQTVSGTDEAPFVAVTQVADYSTLNEVRDGIKDQLAEAGFEEGNTLRWEWRSAQHNPVTATRIADKYAGARPSVIVAIANPSAQSAVSATNNTPIIFSAVTNPVADNLVSNANKPGGNVSGVSDRSPVAQQLALIKEVLPEATTVGIIYDASEEAAVELAGLVNENASAQELRIEEVTVSTAEEVAGAARSLVGVVDAIYIPADKTVSSAIASVIQVGVDNQVPVFAEDADAVEKGAIAAISFDYYDVGKQTGAMVVKVLNGSKPGDLPVEFVEDLKLTINPAAAESMGVALPESVRSRADEVL